MEPTVNSHQPPHAPLVAELVSPRELPAHIALPSGAIGFSGAVTVEEALEADRLLVPGQRLRLWGGVSFLLALSLCLALYTAATWSDWRAAVGTLFLVGILVGLAGRIVVQRLRLFRLARRLYEQRYGTYVETTGYVSPEEVTSYTTFTSTAARWPAFRGYKASINIILLFWDSAPGFVILARGKFASADDWNAVLGIVSSRLAAI